jgi:hypothetical protein
LIGKSISHYRNLSRYSLGDSNPKISSLFDATVAFWKSQTDSPAACSSNPSKAAAARSMHMRCLCKIVPLGFAFALLWGAPTASFLQAQETRGSIMGRIIDQSGAVIPGATVDVISKAMGTKASLPTNDQGFYQTTYFGKITTHKLFVPGAESFHTNLWHPQREDSR